MKIKKQLGSDAVRDLVEEPSERAQQLPNRSVRDPWPSSRRVIIDVTERDTNPWPTRGKP